MGAGEKKTRAPPQYVPSNPESATYDIKVNVYCLLPSSTCARIVIMNPEENIGDVPHIYEMVDNASYMTVKQAQLQSKARSYEKPASDCNKDTAVAATDSCKSMPGTAATVVIACFSILVALGAMGIAVSTMTNMATMQSQVMGLMDADTMETNTSCLCMYTNLSVALRATDKIVAIIYI